MEDQDRSGTAANPDKKAGVGSPVKDPEPTFFQEAKIFNDPVHGHITIHPLCVKIMDTIQFQRLRYIKQLGCCYQVYPGAAHNRFEHSLGVSHLAGTFCKKLQQKQPDLKITPKDVLCVQIAGLCHDLGHGPFSHMFDNAFIPAVIKGSKWKHEKASMAMIDHLIEENDLMKDFVKFNLEDDITFIKELIDGPPENKDNPWPYEGRLQDQSFLYEIVANKESGIDVDKWDYFLRDSHSLGMNISFDCHRLMDFSRVIEVKGKKHICFRDKEEGNLYDMFHTRYLLHRRAYQHKVTKIIEEMYVDALVKANGHYLVAGKEGKQMKMSEAIDDMVAYTKLTDDVILQIMRSPDENLKESIEILERAQKRELYPFIGEYQPQFDCSKENIPKWKDAIVSLSNQNPEDGGQQLTEDQLVIHVVKFNYGMGDKNPIDKVHFYSKKNEIIESKKKTVSRMLPGSFEQKVIRIYCKCKPEELQLRKEATECVEKWWDNVVKGLEEFTTDVSSE
ncbi:deoxynucleoside triphosphate triphosphohydrolase SAMHD1-like [Asterias rubens]|uniref:deoxynucleoside triphosphate triphosphohydrolase SAMHD1-like n=1 Tax=Asterias rubens TaxID=7604 RepID=UPI0014555A36|nr:deoxynucleoside triphosphate triphosphohydrolase SAMHD1-like [Asterias rubens]